MGESESLVTDDGAEGIIDAARRMFAAPEGSRTPSGAPAKYKSPKDAKLGLSLDRMIARGDDPVLIATFAAGAMDATRTLVDARRALRMAVDAAVEGDLDRAAELWNNLDAVAQYHADKFVERAKPGLPALGAALKGAELDAATPGSSVLTAMRARDGNRCRYDGEPVTSKAEVVVLVHALGLERLAPGEAVDVGDSYALLRTQVYPGFTAAGLKTLSLDAEKSVPVPNANAPMAKYYPLTDVRIGDHVAPHAHGGKSNLSNLVVCCNTCNYAKSKWSLDELSTPRLDPDDLSTPQLHQ